VLCFISHARLRVQRAPGFPCALFFGEGKDFACLGRNPRRENTDSCQIAVIASEAKQSMLP
jgi:hypothetical protein